MSMPTRATMLVLRIQLLLLLITQSAVVLASTSPPYPIALPGCQDRCGNISIPYPFGIGLHCSLNSWFNVSCSPPELTLTRLSWNSFGTISNSPSQILGIDLDLLQTSTNDFPTSTLAISGSYNWLDFYDSDLFIMQTLDMIGSPFALMGTRNVLVVKGCGGSVVLKNNTNNDTVTGCSTVCSHDVNPSITGYLSCNGIGCCQTSIPFSLDYFRIEFLTTPNDVWDGIQAAVFDTFYIASKTINDSFSEPETANIPSILQWRVPDLPIDSPEYSNSRCRLYTDRPGGYTCECRSQSYIGNPYLPYGCQVIKECEECVDTCVKAAAGDNSTTYSCPQKAEKPIALAVICSGLGLALSVICSHGLYRFIKRRRKTERRVKFFKVMLQQQSSNGSGSVVERTKVYTHNELDKATNHFNENRILGQGGQGTVYKGMLTDGTIVAIKKSKLMDESQMEPFINEVVILAQINHRNVVTLLGCCLEKEVPLLVYEFVPNGTLSHHIHDPDEDFPLSWALRLKIAADSAGAIAYLHSSSSTPIYHRDIKSANILLDDKYKAKVSDFGTSKNIGIDQTHLTTLVRGTMGYLDPEYFQSNQFTEKSDVYSFGVVLLELLTGRKPIYRDETMEQKNLVIEFLYLMRNSRLSDILDPEVVNGAKEEELIVVAHLARRCLNGSGRLRPTMKEVAMTLEMIIKTPTQMPAQDQQDLPYEEFDENFMEAEISDAKFMLKPLTSSAGSSLYIDVQPLMHSTL